jgi:hypothetical protein
MWRMEKVHMKERKNNEKITDNVGEERKFLEEIRKW